MASASSVERDSPLSDFGKPAVDELFPVVYQELRRLAHAYMRRERPGVTLQTTALVNEAYIRLNSYDRTRILNRKHFLALAAGAMRRILVDHAKSRDSAKRGGGFQKVSLDEAVTADKRSADVIAIDEALTDLRAWDSRKAKIVELRFFGGLNIEETADVMGLSATTVQREWRSAKAWLHRAINESYRSGSGTKSKD